MRKSKIITIEGRGEITIKEVSPWAIYQAWQAKDRMEDISTLLSDALQPSWELVRGWYPSEIEQVTSAFLEVNASFFAIARQLKLDGLLDEVMKTFAASLPAAFADSFSRAMPTPGITAGQPS
jgi:hypothetical protein